MSDVDTSASDLQVDVPSSDARSALQLPGVWTSIWAVVGVAACSVAMLGVLGATDALVGLFS